MKDKRDIVTSGIGAAEETEKSQGNVSMVNGMKNRRPDMVYAVEKTSTIAKGCVVEIE